MKLLGMIILVLSSTIIGVLYSNRIKKKALICDELLDFCDKLNLELNYTFNPVTSIIEDVNLQYLSLDNLRVNTPLKTSLKDEENKRIASYIYSLGKSDAYTQKDIVLALKEYLTSLKNNYLLLFSKKSKIYLSFGLSFGIVISLLLI